MKQFDAPAMQQAMEHLTGVLSKQELAAKAIELLKNSISIIAPETAARRLIS